MRRRIPAFDAVRILAMVLIVCYHWNTHCYVNLIKTPELIPLHIAGGNIATIGVSLFFVLSGASLMVVYRRKCEIRKYLWRRFLSIYPAYWFTYIVMFIYVHILRKRTIHGEFWTWIVTFLGMDGLLNGILPVIYLIGEWFVGCIVWLYLLFPLLRKAVLKYPRLTAAAGVLYAAVCVKAGPYVPLGDHFPLLRVPEMLFGMYFVQLCFPEQQEMEDSARRPSSAAASCEQETKQIPDDRFHRRNLLLFMALGGMVFAGMACVRGELPAVFTDYALGISSFCILTGALTLLPVWKPGAEKAAAAAASLTYEIFLIHHVPIGDFLRGQNAERLTFAQEMTRFAAYCAAIVICAAVLMKAERYLRGCIFGKRKNRSA